MGVKVKDIYSFINEIAPFDKVMEFDNCGLLVGDMNDDVKKVLFSLDITHKVVDEAERLGVNLIISHHPVIFKKISKIEFGSVPARLVSGKINAICAHTNLDMADKYGVNACLADSLGLKNIKPLHIEKEDFFNKIVVFVPHGYEDNVMSAMFSQGAGIYGQYLQCSFSSYGKGGFKASDDAKPFIGKPGVREVTDETKIEMICPKEKTSKVIREMLRVHPYEVPAYDVFENKALSSKISCGLFGEVEDVFDCYSFSRFVKGRLKCKGLRYTKNNRKIKKVAVCSGAGGDYLEFAYKVGADAFVTGEIKHHMLLKAVDMDICVVDAGHFKTEDVVFESLKNLFEKNFHDIEFLKSLDCDDGTDYL